MLQVEATSFHPFQKDTLRGYADLALSGTGLRIRDVSVHQRGERWWVKFPARSYVGRDGETRYQQLLEFDDPAAEARFQELPLKALRFRFPNALAAIPVTARDDGREPHKSTMP